MLVTLEYSTVDRVLTYSWTVTPAKIKAAIWNSFTKSHDDFMTVYDDLLYDFKCVDFYCFIFHIFNYFSIL